MGPVPGDIAEVEAYCRIFRSSERLHSALMDALCNPITGECSVSYEMSSDEKPQLEDKLVSVLGCMVSLVNNGREDVLSGRSSIISPFRVAEVSSMEDELPPLAIFRSEMKRCCESLHVALENYLIPDDDRSLDVWRKLQRLKNVCYDSGFPRGEGHPCHTLFANWSPAYLSISKEDIKLNSDAAFWTGGQVTEEGLNWLLDKGYKTIIDLRAESVNDKFYQAALHDAIASGKIEVVKIPVQVRTAPTMEQVVKFASYVSDCSKGPIYLHSKEGIWRTSAMVSRWRQYMSRSTSLSVSNQAVNSDEMLSYTNRSGNLQSSSMAAGSSSLDKDIDSSPESLGTRDNAFYTWDKNSSPKNVNGIVQSNGTLIGLTNDDWALSKDTAAAKEAESFSVFSNKISPLEAQFPPSDVFSKKKMSDFFRSRKISPPSYFNYQIKILKCLPDSRNKKIERLQGGVIIRSGDNNPVPKVMDHVDYLSGEPQIKVDGNSKLVNGSTTSYVKTKVNGFSEGEMHSMTNARVSTAVNNGFDNVTNKSHMVRDDSKAGSALNNEDTGPVEGNMCASSTGVVRVQSRKKAEMFLVRTDGFSCTREKVTESSLAFTHPSTQQQMLMWKSMPKTVLLLKKLGEELMEEAKQVMIF